LENFLLNLIHDSRDLVTNHVVVAHVVAVEKTSLLMMQHMRSKMWGQGGGDPRGARSRPGTQGRSHTVPPVVPAALRRCPPRPVGRR
jgi:hypothetical protein